MCHGSGLSCLNVLLRPVPFLLPLAPPQLPLCQYTISSWYVSCCQVFAKSNSNCRCRVAAAAAAYVLLLLLCCSFCCCSLTALKSARINIKLAAIKAEKVNTLHRPQQQKVSVRYINCTICHTNLAWRHFAAAFGFYSRAAILFMRSMSFILPAKERERKLEIYKINIRFGLTRFRNKKQLN